MFSASDIATLCITGRASQTGGTIRNPLRALRLVQLLDLAWLDGLIFSVILIFVKYHFASRQVIHPPD